MSAAELAPEVEGQELGTTGPLPRALWGKPQLDAEPSGCSCLFGNRWEAGPSYSEHAATSGDISGCHNMASTMAPVGRGRGAEAQGSRPVSDGTRHLPLRQRALFLETGAMRRVGELMTAHQCHQTGLRHPAAPEKGLKCHQMSGVARASRAGPQAASCDATETPPSMQPPTCPVRSAWDKVLETQVPQPAQNGLKVKRYIGEGIGQRHSGPGYTSPLDASSWERLSATPLLGRGLPEPVCPSRHTLGTRRGL